MSQKVSKKKKISKNFEPGKPKKIRKIKTKNKFMANFALLNLEHNFAIDFFIICALLITQHSTTNK